MAFVEYQLIGYKEVKTRKGSVMYILNFNSQDTEWVGVPGFVVNCKSDCLEGDLEIGCIYRVVKQNGSDFALLVEEIPYFFE